MNNIVLHKQSQKAQEAKPYLWTKELLCYTAGILDNAHYILKGKNDNFALTIDYRNIDKTFMDMLHYNFGGTLVYHIYKHRGTSTTPIWIWTLRGRQMGQLLHQVYFYQIIKREQSLIFLKFLSTITMKQISVETAELREKLIARFNEINNKDKIITNNTKPVSEFKSDELSMLEMIFFDSMK